MNKEINLLNKKIELIQWLSTIEDITVLNKIADLIADKNNKDWWDSASATEKKSIEKTYFVTIIAMINIIFKGCPTCYSNLCIYLKILILKFKLNAYICLINHLRNL
jgi:hypothetical protein